MEGNDLQSSPSVEHNAPKESDEARQNNRGSFTNPEKETPGSYDFPPPEYSGDPVYGNTYPDATSIKSENNTRSSSGVPVKGSSTKTNGDALQSSDTVADPGYSSVQNNGLMTEPGYSSVQNNGLMTDPGYSSVQLDPPRDTSTGSAQAKEYEGLNTSFSNPKVFSPPEEMEENETFLTLDIESHEPMNPSEKARQKAKEAGEYDAESELDKNEFWTDEEEEEDGDGGEYSKRAQAGTKNVLARMVFVIQNVIKMVYTKISLLTKGYLFKASFLVAYFAYFVGSIIYDHSSEGSHRLIVCTIIGAIIMTAGHISKGYSRLSKRLYGANELTPRHKALYEKVRVAVRWLLYGCLAAFMIFCLIDEGRNKPQNLRGVPGLFLFLFILVLFCPKPHLINWHTVYWSFGLQFIFAVGMLKWKSGRDGVMYIQDRLDEFFESTKSACKFVFGDTYMDHFIIFSAMPMMFFTNAALTILYHMGAVQYFVKVVGGFLNYVLNTSPTESTAVTVAMFMDGMSTLLTMREYLPYLSKSQLFLVMTAIHASIGGALLAILSQLGVPLKHLISAMAISAPATFAVCKIMIPETKWTKEKDKGRQERVAKRNEKKQEYSGLMDAAQSGAVMMVSVVGSIFVMMFTFLSFIDWVNSTLTWFGDRIGIEKLTIEYISSYLLYPVALMMGIEPEDCRAVGSLLGYRISINCMIGFFKLRTLQVNKVIYHRYMRRTNYNGAVHWDGDDMILVEMNNKTLKGGFISDRSEAIITYSMCGFSSMMYVFMMIGAFCTLVPSRKKWILSMALPALVAGNVANCMTGSFASLFY